jgi:hypothetical protein
VAEYGEWSRKGATLSDVTARKDYGVNSDFIVKGINAGKLEYREGAIHGNPYIRVLRRPARGIHRRGARRRLSA